MVNVEPLLSGTFRALPCGRTRRTCNSSSLSSGRIQAMLPPHGGNRRNKTSSGSCLSPSRGGLRRYYYWKARMGKRLQKQRISQLTCGDIGLESSPRRRWTCRRRMLGSMRHMVPPQTPRARPLQIVARGSPHRRPLGNDLGTLPALQLCLAKKIFPPVELHSLGKRMGVGGTLGLRITRGGHRVWEAR